MTARAQRWVPGCVFGCPVIDCGLATPVLPSTMRMRWSADGPDPFSVLWSVVALVCAVGWCALLWRLGFDGLEVRCACVCGGMGVMAYTVLAAKT